MSALSATQCLLPDTLASRLAATVDRFCQWLEHYGELSYDFQSFYASKAGQRAKALYYRAPVLGTLAVAPMVLSEALVPSARRLFWKPQRFPIADAHFAMGFAFLAKLSKEEQHYRKAVHFLEVLERTRCRGYKEYCWGYPYDWQTKTGLIKEGTALITTVPYVYEAFDQVYALDHDLQWLEIMQSVAEHAFTAYRDIDTGPDSASCGYTPSPDDPCGVINASAYRAFLLTKAGIELARPDYLEVARRNLNCVIDSQREDGSWYYATNANREFVDHFHTCFVLKALAKIELLNGCRRSHAAIERGIDYYLSHLIDMDGLPVPFAKAPRITVYRRELYDLAECINLATLLRGRFSGLDRVLISVLTDLVERWQQPDGSFRSRQLRIGWDNVPMLRWGQSQVFRSLCLLLSQARTEGGNGTTPPLLERAGHQLAQNGVRG